LDFTQNITVRNEETSYCHGAYGNTSRVLTRSKYFSINLQKLFRSACLIIILTYELFVVLLKFNSTVFHEKWLKYEAESGSIHNVWVHYAKKISLTVEPNKSSEHAVSTLQDLELFPWEMLIVLQDHPVCRVPNLHMLYALYKGEVSLWRQS